MATTVASQRGAVVFEQGQHHQPPARRKRRRPSWLVASAAVSTAIRGTAAQTVYTCPAKENAIPWVANPAAKYTWSAQYPQSCTCELNVDANSACPLFNCDCICDITAGKCDYNCCCDQECSNDQIARFQALDTCLPEGPGPSSTVYCYDKGQLVSVNPWGPLSAADTAQAALDNLLCVQKDNSPSKGQFYEDPGLLSAAAISTAEGTKFTSYGTAITAAAGRGPTEGDAIYDQGDRIPAAFVSAGGGAGLQAAYGGYFPAPGPDSAGAGDWVTVTVSAVTYQDWDTGAQSDFTARYNCDAFYFDGAAAAAGTGTCNLGGGGTLAAAAATAPAACYNALLSVCYTITHDGAGSIVAADARIVVTDVPEAAAAAAAAAAAGGGGGAFAAQQSFTVQFASTAAVTASDTQGNAAARVRSGSPGYLVGAPVLAGLLSADGATVAAPQRGLQMLGGGACSAGGGGGTAATAGVEFGYDALACCALALTRAELAQLCNGGGGAVAADGVTPLALSALAPAGTLIGSYGNADPLDPGQWLAAEVGTATSTATWSDALGTCSGVTAGLAWRFLWAPVGARAAAQARVVAADARYTTQDWAWRDGGGGDAAETQSFLVCSSVSFVQYGSEAVRYTPPPPPIAFSVPWDVFYPFYVYSGAAGAGLGVGDWACRALLMVAAFAAQYAI
ncbi:hypothetical protein JKP88DRAFT_204591 [Tribonema minus]|uniref:Tectonic-1-3 N-terminal domain-containing protein n=1 Tax=Tribonema minus TaxID=303371 RepID=A0A835ZCT9_9STRA|nr:hypothetical protein JKP88DRAFT_204591 [Tribonema minus]